MSSSYEQTIEELKKIKKARVGYPQNHQKGQKGVLPVNGEVKWPGPHG